MHQHILARLLAQRQNDIIALRKDSLRLVLWGSAPVLLGVATWFAPDSLLPATERTLPAFVTLGAIIVAGRIAQWLGFFQWLARVALPECGPTLLATAELLGFTALVSSLVNLDVAAVVAPPIAVQVAGRRGLNAGRLVVATALTANAASFLLPTSNLTNLLILDRSPAPAYEYLREDWASWLLVTLLTVGCLAWWTRKTSSGGAPAPFPGPVLARPIAPTLLDLLPMLVVASAIRALLADGLSLPGSFAAQFLAASLLAAGANNLPAAAAARAPGGAIPWAAIWAMAMGPNLLVTGSMATIICRRSARDLGVGFESATFSIWGAVLLPLQFAAGWAGLALLRLA